MTFGVHSEKIISKNCIILFEVIQYILKRVDITEFCKILEKNIVLTNIIFILHL